MTREAIISKTLKVLSALPAEKAEEVADFASYVLKKHEDALVQHGIEKMIVDGNSFKFLTEEDDIYTLEDVKEKY